jgi:predicted nuclease with TOPRIM domain
MMSLLEEIETKIEELKRTLASLKEEIADLRDEIWKAEAELSHNIDHLYYELNPLYEGFYKILGAIYLAMETIPEVMSYVEYLRDKDRWPVKIRFKRDFKQGETIIVTPRIAKFFVEEIGIADYTEDNNPQKKGGD